MINRRRNANLDLLRATAILSVVIFHTLQFVDQYNPIVAKYIHLGSYGVDLFFVLSGYLIGSLYWKELKFNGFVNKIHFLLRRVLRTVPPYLAALALAYSAVFVARGEAFNWGYLIFIQNYYSQMPFFLVSWSLCVEEHFYLVVVLLLPKFISPTNIKYNIRLLIFLSLLPLVFRALNYDLSGHGFSYYSTATHFRFEGLVLGVLIAYLHISTEFKFTTLINHKKSALALIALTLLLLPWAPLGITYVFGFYVVAIIFSVLLLFAVETAETVIAKSRSVKQLAYASYSIYLTHSLAIQAVLFVKENYFDLPMVVHFVMTIVFIYLVGIAFYLVVEKPTMRLRDMMVPSSKRQVYA